MDFPVTVSSVPLEFDTLPALKTTFFHHGAENASRDIAGIYTMSRLYMLDGQLKMSLTAFERELAADSRIAFAFGGVGAQQFAAVVLAPKSGAQLCYVPSAVPMAFSQLQAGEALKVEPFAGVDEQGWCWGAKITLPPEALEKAGCHGCVGDGFAGALFKYCLGSPYYGASFKPGNSLAPLDFSGFNRFVFATY